jgi:hypothetical protein
MKTQPTTPDIIDRIVAAARRPCPQIVEAVRFVDPETGRGFLWNGVPASVDASKLVRTVFGYVYFDGACTYGQRYPSREAAEQAHEERQRRIDERFRQELLAMPPERLSERAAYWLKGVT